MRSAGADSGALAVDLDSGAQLYSLRAGAPRMPASVEKLYTSAAALRTLGAAGRLHDRRLAGAAPDAARRRPRRPLPARRRRSDLRRRDADGLAQRLADAGITAVRGRVVGDESPFDARRGVPSSGFRLTSEVGPLSALTFDRGRSGERPLLPGAAGGLRRHGVRQAAAARGRRRRAPRRSRRHAARRAADRRLALAAAHRAAAADEPAVGQLHRRDAGQGARRPLRRRRDDGGRAPP